MSMNFHPYPGIVISDEITLFQPSESKHIAGIVILSIVGLLVILSLAFLIVYFFKNRKKGKAGRVRAFSLKHALPKILNKPETQKAEDKNIQDKSALDALNINASLEIKDPPVPRSGVV